MIISNTDQELEVEIAPPPSYPVEILLDVTVYFDGKVIMMHLEAMETTRKEISTRLWYWYGQVPSQPVLAQRNPDATVYTYTSSTLVHSLKISSDVLVRKCKGELQKKLKKLGYTHGW